MLTKNMATLATKFKVLVTHPEVPDSALKMLTTLCEVTICNNTTRSELLHKCRGVDVAYSVEVKRRGIKLGHTPNIVNDAVTEIAIGLMIVAGRGFHEGREQIERNQSPNEDLYNARHGTMDHMLKESDFVIVACPLTAETKGIIDNSVFNKMKPISVFINIARGEIVNQRDFLDALLNKRIFAAGLDVMTPEPLPEDDELLKVRNCVMIPHLGAATEKTEEAMSKVAAENVLNALSGFPMISPAF